MHSKKALAKMVFFDYIICSTQGLGGLVPKRLNFLISLNRLYN